MRGVPHGADGASDAMAIQAAEGLGRSAPVNRLEIGCVEGIERCGHEDIWHRADDDMTAAQGA